MKIEAAIMPYLAPARRVRGTDFNFDKPRDCFKVDGSGQSRRQLRADHHGRALLRAESEFVAIAHIMNCHDRDSAVVAQRMEA